MDTSLNLQKKLLAILLLLSVFLTAISLFFLNKAPFSLLHPCFFSLIITILLLTTWAILFIQRSHSSSKIAHLRLEEILKTLQDEQWEKQTILESLEEGVISCDAQMRICSINFVGSKMIGIPRKKLLGQLFSHLMQESHSPLLGACYELLKKCQEHSHVLTDSISLMRTKRIRLDLIATPKGSQKGTILILQDTSNHYKVLEMGKDFVANASHELRTPITIVKGFAETLQDLPELPKEMVIEITEKIVRNCQRMETLIKNLLTLADLQNLPECRFQECDLTSFAESCRQTILAVHEKVYIDIEKEGEEITIDADPDLLELAITNLLENAAKYSNQPAHITISIKREGEEANIAISDQGIGIPPNDLEEIFERFYTVDKARSRRLGGTGLGLSIVKTIIEKHQGTITASSLPGKGTTFSILLPLKSNECL